METKITTVNGNTLILKRVDDRSNPDPEVQVSFFRRGEDQPVFQDRVYTDDLLQAITAISKTGKR